MNSKIMAFYLPQFHRVPENDEWWGKGFTEWTAVKGAAPLFEGHYQPRVPLNHNYYNLLEHDTMAWQANLMKKYSIDGVCIYHYWFENGRRILEKPAENLLKWTDISMPFCFCWANETWSRTWEKLADANVWSIMYEPKNGKKNDNGILLRQSYGREQDWEEHFQYLLPFFEDDRYIKFQGKPVFVILKPDNIFPLWSMMHYFDIRAKENNLPGIYVIGMSKKKLAGLDAACLRQPTEAVLEYLDKRPELWKSFRKYSYDEIWEIILRQKLYADKTYLCGVVDFDTSPRMGQRGQAMMNTDPQIFYHYLKKLYQKSLMLNNEYIFLNAWNEWGEGMYLEPDEKNGYRYLEAIHKVVTECREEGLPQIIEWSESFYETEAEIVLRRKEDCVKALQRHDKLLDDWMYLRDHAIDFSKYFRKYGYQNIAIYGMGKLGTHLMHELDGKDVKVIFGIDKNRKLSKTNIKVYSPDEAMPQVDAVVITVFGEYGEIGEKLSRNMDCSMVTLEEIIEELIVESRP